MAIKGKRRRKRRGVAAAPQPVYVQPKRPLLGRRWFQITALGVIVVGAAVSITIALIIQHHSNQKKAQEAAEVRITERFGTEIDNALSGVGQQFQDQFTPFPTLSSDIASFKSGTLSASDASTKATGYAAAARTAYDTIQKIDVA